MASLRSFAALAALACASASLTVGCGCDPGNSSVRAPVEFTPSSSEAIRTPATCGAAADAAFSAGDTFALDLLGETDVAPPYTRVTLKLTASAPVDVPVPLDVRPPSSNVTVASSRDGAVQFSLAAGSNTAELDLSPLASVVVTVTSLPTADGASLSARLHLTFEDGRALDQVYGAPLETVPSPCN